MDKELWQLYMQLIHSGGIGDIEAWTKLELTMPQLKVLMVLSHHQEITIGKLAEILDASLPNMTGIIDRLSQMDLVERMPSEKDKRAVLLQLTNKAKQLFYDLNQSGIEHFKKVEQLLTEHEKELIKLGFKVLIEKMKIL